MDTIFGTNCPNDSLLTSDDKLQGGIANNNKSPGKCDKSGPYLDKIDSLPLAPCVLPGDDVAAAAMMKFGKDNVSQSTDSMLLQSNDGGYDEVNMRRAMKM